MSKEKKTFDLAIARAEHFVFLYDITKNKRKRKVRSDWSQKFIRLMSWRLSDPIMRIDGDKSMLILRSPAEDLSYEKFERTILIQIPGYKIISNALKGFAENKTAYRAELVQLYGPGTRVFGFVMEDNDDGSVTVFVPAVPTLTVGSLHVVNRELITILEAGSIDVTNCISQWGVGSQKILGSISL